MDDVVALCEAADRMCPRAFNDLLDLLTWIATQPDSEEEACERAIDDFARQRGLNLSAGRTH